MGTKNKKTTRVPFNWAKLKKLWDEGKSYFEMAKALDSHYKAEGDDPTKSIRAKCSVAMNKGVMIDGKLVHFKRRSKPLEAKEQKSKAVSKKPPSKRAKAPTRTLPKKVTATPKGQKPKSTAKKPTTVVPIKPVDPELLEPAKA